MDTTEDLQPADAPKGELSRRTIVKGAAWALPVIAVAAAAPLAAASTPRTLTPAQPATLAPIVLRAGQVYPQFGGRVSTTLTDDANAAPISGAVVTYTLTDGTGSARLNSNQGSQASVQSTDAAGRSFSEPLYGRTAGNATLTASTPNAQPLVYPVIVQHAEPVTFTDIVHVGNVLGVPAPNPFTFFAPVPVALDFRIDLAAGEVEPGRLFVRFRNMPANIWGQPVIGEPLLGAIGETANWSVARDGNDIVLTRMGGKQGGPTGPANVRFTVFRQSSTAGQASSHLIEAELTAESPYRAVGTRTQSEVVLFNAI